MLRTSVLSVLLASLLINYQPASGGHQWGYSGQTGPDHWDGLCQSGTDQSPINLEESTYDPAIEPLKLKNYDEVLSGVTLLNNGHTAVLNHNSNFSAEISEGGLGGTYRFAQLHFHWGGNSEQGSEHQIDGKAFPMEVHLVHYNTK
jgi:carbonic anhydrase